MPSPKLSFVIRRTLTLTWFPLLVLLGVILSLFFWQAPWRDRINAIAISSIFGGCYCLWCSKRTCAYYPAQLYLEQNTWFCLFPHQARPISVSFKGSTYFTPYFSSLSLKAENGKNYNLLVTPQSFKNRSSYYALIRAVKIH